MYCSIPRHQEVDRKEQRDGSDLSWRWVGVSNFVSVETVAK